MRNNRVIIIGSGIGGLAAGIRLAADGYRVQIMEKAMEPGGWLRMTRAQGFRFHNGGAILTMPHLLEALFSYTGRDLHGYLDWIKLDPIMQVLSPDSTAFRLFREPADTVMKNKSFELRDQQAFNAYTKRSERILDAVSEQFFSKPLSERHLPFHHPFRVRRYNPGRSIVSMANQRFENETVQQAMSVWPILCGGNPSEASHYYRMIPTALERWGAWLPVGGAEALLSALLKLFRECGGELITNAEVSAIRIFNNRANGIRLIDGSIIQADHVICNAETGAACRFLIDSDQRTYRTVKKAEKKEPGLSAFIYHIVLNEPPTEKEPLEAFNLLLPRDIPQWEETLFKTREFPRESAIMLNIEGKIDPSNVPEGKYGMTAIVPVPNLSSELQWDRDSYRYRSMILDQLQTYFENDLRESLVCEQFISPKMIRRENGADLGSAWSFSPTQNGKELPRLANRAPDIRNLYFVGNGAHPGPFIPAILKGAELTAAAITK